MKTLLTLFVLFFSSSVVAEWKAFGTLEIGGKFYVHMDTVKMDSGYLYFWEMQDYNNVPNQFGDLSTQVYIMGDCKLNRIKTLSYIYYKEPMGAGKREQEESVNKDWKYPAPDTIHLLLLSELCKSYK